VPFPIPLRYSRSLPRVLGIVLVLASSTMFCDLRGDEPGQAGVPFPTGYREWVHVKSGVLGAEFPAEPERGIHHVYANKAALSGLASGTFEDGSILVYDLVSISEKGGVGTEGARRRIDVMIKDSKHYPDSGGWDFGRFMGDDHEKDVLTSDVRKVCFQCHEKQKAHGFAFSEFRK
jgi:hypothetical protein